MTYTRVELNREAVVQSPSFLSWPEKPREFFLLCVRLILLNSLLASIVIVLYLAFSTNPYVRIPFPSRKHETLPQFTAPTNLSHLLFCIGGAAQTWNHRSRYVSRWWSNTTRGVVWLDERLANVTEETENSISEFKESVSVRVSDPGWKKFKYSTSKAGVRIARIIWDSYKLGLPNVRWYVMGDDDTVYFPDNLVSMLGNYDHNQMWYIGGNSESVEQDEIHTYDMAFGGGGFAISQPLAKRLVSAMDGCLDRYYYFYGSDQRIAACISDIGVPLTRELGFHQLDIRGDPYGFLAAHPLAPLISLHHLDYLEPLFPNQTKIGSLDTLMRANHADPKRILQQSFCYDHKRKWSVSISWGYTVQIYTSLLAAKDLKMPLRTFRTWHRNEGPFTFNTRPQNSDPCEKPVLYFLDQVKGVGLNETRTSYSRDMKSSQKCDKPEHPSRSMEMQTITVSSWKLEPDYWNKAPRRQCCEVMDEGGVMNTNTSSMFIQVRKCRSEELISF